MKPITWIQPTTAHHDVCFSFRRWINLARLRYAKSRIKLIAPPQAAARRNPNPLDPARGLPAALQSPLVLHTHPLMDPR